MLNQAIPSISEIFTKTDKPILKSQSKLTLTPKKAAELSAMDLYNGQRDKSPARLAFITNAIENGTWYGNIIAIAELSFNYKPNDPDYDGPNLKKLIVNGGHTLAVHEALGITTQHNNLQIWQCKTIKSLSVLYNMFDCKESSRTAKDQCKAFIDIMPDQHWTQQSINTCSAAASVVEHGASYRSVTKTVANRIQILLSDKYYRAATKCRDMVYRTEGGRARNRFLTKAESVVATMLNTFIIHSGFATVFWDRVRTGADLKHDSPELALRDVLMKASGGQSRNAVTIFTVKYLCRRAWNLACENDKVPNGLSRRLPHNLPELMKPTKAAKQARGL